MYYESVFKIFQKRRVKYLIAGGMAVNLYGVPRFTKDLDILIDPAQQNLKRLEAALHSLGYRPKTPVTLKDFLNPKNWIKWKKEKGMFAFNLYRPKKPFEEIDLLVNLTLSFRKAFRNSETVRAGTLRLRLVGIDDLIRLKKKAGRAQDLADIEALRKVKKVRRQRI